tara:strand:- start:152 stop:409 length:258 start_codon:yes stop_codon:yes gene_type:complete
MNQINITLTREELEQIIEDTVYKATSSTQLSNEKLISENELSEKIGISKVTLHKFRKSGVIPFIKANRTIRYNYQEVIDALKHKS